MNMSEKLQLIAENMQRVYDAGALNSGGGITPSGAINITENGTHDVTRYAEAVVDVPTPQPTGSITITENGTHDVAEYAEAVVNVEGTGAGGTLADFQKTGAIVDSIAMVVTNMQSLSMTFAGCSALSSITLIMMDEGCAFHDTFKGCTSLTELGIYPVDHMKGCISENGFDVSDCINLSANTINWNILCNLVDKTADTSGTQWVCTLGETNLGKLSISDIALATEKGWTLQ